MSQKIKIVLLKELKESYQDKKTLRFLVFSFIFSLVIYILSVLIHPNSTQSTLTYSQFIMMAIFALFYMNNVNLKLITEKFYNEMLFNNFQSMFTLPIKVKDMILGKILSMFIISIPSTLILSTIFLLIYYMQTTEYINIFKILFFTIFLPLALGTIYSLTGLWALIRFGELNIMKMLENMLIFGFLGMFGIALCFINYLKPENLSISNTIIVSLTIIIIISAIIVIYSFKNIKKEYLYRNMEKQG
ncbi:MAG: hypothetical protein LBR15_06475 [Methanobrevibacter sp.]|jgi:hypothetical protein|nr:hypothetical protein [Candidatus Methanovirga australis]